MKKMLEIENQSGVKVCSLNVEAFGHGEEDIDLNWNVENIVDEIKIDKVARLIINISNKSWTERFKFLWCPDYFQNADPNNQLEQYNHKVNDETFSQTKNLQELSST